MSTWKNKLDSLTVEYLKDLTRKDITKIAPGDSTQIDSAAVRDNIAPKDTTICSSMNLYLNECRHHQWQHR